MAVVVHIPGYLREFTGGARSVTLDSDPATVGEALARLWAIHPGVRDRVVTEQGQVRPHVNLFVGTESIRHTGGLSTRLPGDAEISIVPAVSGGRSGPGHRSVPGLAQMPSPDSAMLRGGGGGRSGESRPRVGGLGSA